MALKVLAFLAGEDDAFSRFLTLSGIRPEELRERASDPFVLAAVLDFLLGDDGLLASFAEGEGIAPTVVHHARRALPGATPEA